MKKIIYTLAFASVLLSCKTGQTSATTISPEVNVSIDLNTVQDDKVMVTLLPTPTNLDIVTFSIPKTVPGTYSTDNYGKYIENVKAFDAKGNELAIAKIDENSWKITNAKKLQKVTYWVNDTFDTETGKGDFGGGDIFSPAGTNISPENFMLNTHGFIGYFSDKLEVPYTTTILHSANLFGATSMTDTDLSATQDVFKSFRYADLVEHPIMYAKPDYTTFKVDDMEILISVYSPNGTYKVADIAPAMETMMRAQKKFLGAINSTKKYAVLLYLSDMKKPDAKGFGALEHPTSTTVVMPEMIPKEEMAEQLKDVVSHEFFHIVTPLGVHSKEIQYFDFNAPKMSKHLWMYEGVTEYFANLFQVNQGLISEDEFYNRMSDKISQAAKMNDTMPFTTMSANVLNKPYKDQYLNVYQKGALIGMCLDIIIRENSHGERGILDLMQKLTNEYGATKPFNDNELFDKIVSLTYPEVKNFLETYVSGPTPIPYDKYFAKVGVTQSKRKIPGNVFLKDQKPYITINPNTKEIMVLPTIELPSFYANLGIKNGDIIKTVNGTNYNLDNIYDLITESQKWEENTPITIKIKRDTKETELKGIVKLPYDEAEGLQATDASKNNIKNAWLKG
ncbi:M61 family metallopeptidase [Flavobacterium psychrophilum]|uniref:M61 family metallopeptidase n=1 Tax=Flavobacterium psychrophilum TaxID=96345 RepID=UPI000B7C0D53|nr:peptidase M61 [Flavobacterium psychrophilum]SNA73180.1 putative M61 family peptidase [Flavobacterium psychrophilum]SNB35107.1 putative M61 family peptidase [Flavobacterium psychrophilum]